MKATIMSVALLSVFSTALAQSLPPAPTESVGCEPHGDHWHCAGPRPASSTSAGAAQTTAAHDDHDDDDHASGTGVLPPSPTASIGCEPHGDHWHCAGPRPASTTSAAAVTTTSRAPTTSAAATSGHGAGTGVLPPSPTASVGCEPHGDHWHCAGPRVTSSVTSSPSAARNGTSSTAAPSSTGPVQAGAAGVMVPVVGLFGVVAMVL